jgi:succinyl-CoA:acetate CoA-transferase
LGKLDVALIEVTAILEDGRVVPSSSIGNNKTWIDCAERIILEVNSWEPMALEGMHDIYYGLEPPPNRKPIPLLRPGDRIGSPYLKIPAEKIVGIVLTDSPDRNRAFKAPDEASKKIAGHILADMASYRERIVLRPQEISNNPGITRRLGVIAMNGMIEADIYGNVNSTHVLRSRIQNGIGGSGDFARNGYLSIFMAPSSAKKGTISTIVPMVSHVDHTEHGT